MTTKAGIVVMHRQAKEGRELLSIAEVKRKVKNCYHQSVQREHGSGDTLISDSETPDHERIYFCFFKAPCVWYFVMVALGNLKQQIIKFSI